MNATVLDLVVAGTGSAGQRDAVRAAVASVPGWFREVAAPPEPAGTPGSGPHVAWVLADDDAWPQVAAAAIERGAAAVVIDTPRLITPADLATLSEPAGPTGGRCPVIVATRRSHAPQVRAFARLLRPLRDQVEWAELLVVEDGVGPVDGAPGLWDALTTLAAAGLDVEAIESIAVGQRTLLVDARSVDAHNAGARVHVTTVGSRGAAPRMKLAAFGAFGSLTAQAGSPLVASAGDVVRVSPDGACSVPTEYLTPRRLALREVYAFVVDGVSVAPPLSAYEREVALVGQSIAWSIEPDSSRRIRSTSDDTVSKE